MVGLIVSFARELIESKLCGLRFLISHLGQTLYGVIRVQGPSASLPTVLGEKDTVGSWAEHHVIARSGSLYPRSTKHNHSI